MQSASFRFGGWQAIVIAGIYMLVSSTVAVAVEKLLSRVWPESFTGVQPLLIGLGAGFTVATAAVLWRERALNRVPWPQWGEGRASRRILAFALVTTCGLMPVLSELDNQLHAIWPVAEWMREYFAQLTAIDRHPWLAVAAIAVVGPVAEELVFRGIILRGLLQTMSERGAIIGSALIFAGMHLNPWQLLPTLVIGVLLGWIYVRTRSLGVCIAAHGANNLLALLTGLFADRIPGVTYASGAGPQSQPWWLTTIGAVVLMAGLAGLRRELASHRQISRVPPFGGVGTSR